MDLALDGKAALITGAAGGIGAATARLLGREGAHLGLVDLDHDRLTKLTQTLATSDGQVVADVVDVADQAAAHDRLMRMHETLGGVDILINAAGVLRLQSVVDLTVEDWIGALRANLVTAAVATSVLLAPMRQQRHGTVLMVTSDLARQPAGIDVAYEAAKAGLGVLVKVLATQEAGHGIRVNGVAPGPIDTPMLTPVKQAALVAHGGSPSEAMRRELGRRGQAMGRLGQPEEVADALVWLASDRASYITGQILGVDGGTIQGLP